MFDFPVNLGHGFLAAHGENGVAQPNQNSDEPYFVGKGGVA